MCFHATHLLPDILFQVVKGIEMGRFTGEGSHLRGQMRPQFVFPNPKQSAIRVVDDDEFLRVQQVMGNNQRPDRIFGGNSARIANHMGVSRL